MSTTVTYKGSTLTTVDNQTRTLLTSGKYMEDDITLVDVSGGGTPTVDDLTGTKWFFFQDVDIGDIFNPAMAITYSLNFTDDYGGLYTQMTRWMQNTLRYGSVSVYSSSWSGNAAHTYRFVTITGGASATDPDCIDWFKSNAYYCMTV